MRETSEDVLMTGKTCCSWLYLLSRCEVLAADVALDLTVVSSSKSDSAQSDFELFSSKLGSVVELSFFGLRRCARPCLHLSRQIHTCDVIGRDSPNPVFELNGCAATPRHREHLAFVEVAACLRVANVKICTLSTHLARTARRTCPRRPPIAHSSRVLF